VVTPKIVCFFGSGKGLGIKILGFFGGKFLGYFDCKIVCNRVGRVESKKSKKITKIINLLCDNLKKRIAIPMPEALNYDERLQAKKII
jgi:hypothetical protein